MSLEFKVQSSSGIETVSFDNIDELLKCWGTGAKPDFVTGTLTTLDGSHVIVPSNEQSHQSLISHYKENGCPVQFDSTLLNGILNMDNDQLSKIGSLLIDSDFTEAFKHDLGTARIVKKNTPTYHQLKSDLLPDESILSRIMQPQGSIHRSDIMICDDENSMYMIVFDKIGTCDFEQMKDRPLYYGEVISFLDEDELGIGDFTAETKFMGDASLLENVKERSKALNLADRYDVIYDGFCNSRDMPLNDLYSVLHLGNTDLFTDSSNSEVSVTRVTKAVCLAAGSRESNFYVSMDGVVEKLLLGDFVSISPGQEAFKRLEFSELGNLNRVSNSQLEQVPF